MNEAAVEEGIGYRTLGDQCAEELRKCINEKKNQTQKLCSDLVFFFLSSTESFLINFVLTRCSLVSGILKIKVFVLSAMMIKGDEKQAPTAGNTSSRLEEFLILAKTARGAAAVDLIKRVTEVPGVHAFGELLELTNIREVSKISVIFLMTNLFNS